MSIKINSNIMILVVLALCVLTAFTTQCIRAKSIQEENFKRNAYITLMPLIELQAEAGQSYETAIATHYDLITMSLNKVKRNRPSLTSKLLQANRINLKKLERLQQVLEYKDSENGLTANEKIVEAQKLSLELLIEISESLDDAPASFEGEKITKEMQDSINKALTEAQANVLSFVNELDSAKTPFNQVSVDKAQGACESNRKSISLIVIASLISQDIISHEDLLKMRVAVDRAIYGNQILQKSKLFNDEVNNRLEAYTQSEYRRRDITQKLIEGDLEQAQKLLFKAMHEAISKGQKLNKKSAA